MSKILIAMLCLKLIGVEA